MKLGDKTLEPFRDIAIIPRGSDNLIFHFQTVLDVDNFEDKHPQPDPPTVTTPDGATTLDRKDPDYLQESVDWINRMYDYTFLKSIEITPDLEWETVDMDNPETWHNFDKELSIFLSRAEINLLIMKSREVNGLDERKLEAARADFLSGNSSNQKD